MNAPHPSAVVTPTAIDRQTLNARTDSASTLATPSKPADTGRADTRYSLDHTRRSNTMLVATVRAVLAIVSVFVIWFTPQESGRFVVYASLIAYSIYSALVVAALARSRNRLPNRALAWVDIAFAGYLVGLTEGTNSIFFFFFTFPILSAAFTRGFREGMQITVASAVVFVIAGLVTMPSLDGQELDRMLIRPVYLLTLGLLVSHWGGGELELKRQLGLLREIASARYFRVGAGATIDAALRRVCAHFDADRAVLAIERSAPRGSGTLYTVSAATAGARPTSAPASNETIRMFMAVSERVHTWPRRRLPERYLPMDLPSQTMEIAGSEDAVSALAHLLEAKCVAVVAYRQRDGVEGRLVLARNRKRFANTDAIFLAQCARALAPVVETIVLTEELVARAAEFERLGISRDLHDTTVQPYIGLRMAIEGIAREFRDSPRVAERLRQLAEMTDLGIEELRDYTMRLRTGSRAGTLLLGTAIERQAARLARFYGLGVELQFDASLRLETRVADAVFQMVSEGLSNVVRHTLARNANVAIRHEEDCCVVEITNPLPNGFPSPGPFVPRSIAERATDLGGRIAVETARDGQTAVTVWIPLRRPPR